MSSQSLDGLTVRLEALERDHRRLKGLFLVAVLSLVALAATDGPPKTIEAQEFVLRDGTGKIRARLGLSEMTYALPPSPKPSPTGTPDPLDRLLDKGKPGSELKVQEVRASIACLTFMGSGGSPPAAEQCTSWEDQAWTSLRFRVGGHDQVSISADGDGTQLNLGGIRSRHAPEDRGRVSLGAHREGAWLRIDEPPNKEALLEPHSLTISDEGGRPPRVFPGNRKP